MLVSALDVRRGKMYVRGFGCIFTVGYDKDFMYQAPVYMFFNRLDMYDPASPPSLVYEHSFERYFPDTKLVRAPWYRCNCSDREPVMRHIV